MGVRGNTGRPLFRRAGPAEQDSPLGGGVLRSGVLYPVAIATDGDLHLRRQPPKLISTSASSEPRAQGPSEGFVTLDIAAGEHPLVALAGRVATEGQWLRQ